jgi:glutathione peroxidase
MTAFFSCVEIVNRNSVHMTYRQKFLKAVYPAWMWLLNLTGRNTTILTKENATAPVPIYSLKDTLINGTPFNLASCKGKKILLVNTASDCSYTNQYADLEKLYEKYKDKLLVIGFPANDFSEQEKGTNAAIAQFCKANFGVSFPIMKKSSVVKGVGQNETFKWLTDSTRNGWNNKQPAWNFCKYLVDENGRLVNYFGSTIQPFSTALINAIKK